MQLAGSYFYSQAARKEIRLAKLCDRVKDQLLIAVMDFGVHSAAWGRVPRSSTSLCVHSKGLRD